MAETAAGERGVLRRIGVTIGFTGGAVAVALAFIATVSMIPGSARGQQAPGPVASFACNEFPPHKMEASPDGLRGFDIDILSEALQRQGVSVTVQFYPWMRALQMVEGGRLDGLCSCSYSLEREKTLLYSDEIGTVGVGFFTALKGGQESISLHDLKDRPVGVVRGYSLGSDLTVVGAKIVEVNSDETGLRMLEQGRIDAFYSYRDTVRYIAARMGAPLTFTYHEVRMAPYYVCLSRSRPGAFELLNALNTGLQALRISGRDEAIRAQYR